MEQSTKKAIKKTDKKLVSEDTSAIFFQQVAGEVSPAEVDTIDCEYLACFEPRK